MKKIMFSTEYGLQQGVIARTKTMTRRVDKKLNHPLVTDISEWGIDDKGKCYLTITYSTGLTEDVYPAYQIGEEIAIAQPYKDICLTDPIFFEGMRREAGWNNKMFVKAEYMPHRIRITDIKAEHLQDISDEDCLREGIFEDAEEHGGLYTTQFYDFVGNDGDGFATPREAFAALIDRVSGRGTWQDNPWVVAYTMDLQRAEGFKEQETNK